MNKVGGHSRDGIYFDASSPRCHLFFHQEPRPSILYHQQPLRRENVGEPRSVPKGHESQQVVQVLQLIRLQLDTLGVLDGQVDSGEIELVRLVRIILFLLQLDL